MQITQESLPEILNAESIEDLKKIGSVSDVLMTLNLAFKPFVLDTDHYDDLLDAVRAIRESWPQQTSGPFVSRQAEVIFYLTKTDGKLRKKLLEITDDHYRDRVLAKKWYRSIAQVIYADRIGGDSVPFQILSKLYEEMTFDGGSDE